MTITILKALSIIIVLAVMVLILLSVNHMLRGNFDSKPSDMARMREDLEDNDRVITDDSVFGELVKVRQVNQRPIDRRKENA